LLRKVAISRRIAADGAGRVAAAGALTIARTVEPARWSALRRALVLRVDACRDHAADAVDAAAFERRRARNTDPVARRITAHAVHAELIGRASTLLDRVFFCAGGGRQGGLLDFRFFRR
jgi:hypothetical protein